MKNGFDHFSISGFTGIGNIACTTTDEKIQLFGDSFGVLNSGSFAWVSYFWLGLVSDHGPPIWASHIAGIIGVHHSAWFNLLKLVLTNFFARMALDCVQSLLLE